MANYQSKSISHGFPKTALYCDFCGKDLNLDGLDPKKFKAGDPKFSCGECHEKHQPLFALKVRSEK